MTFTEALAAMKKGERVRRKRWLDENFIVIIFTPLEIADRNGHPVDFWIEDYEATDWQIVARGK